MRRCICILLLLCLSFSAFAQDSISYKILQGYDRMFYNTNNPQIEVMAYNKNDYERFNGKVDCRVETYKGESVYEFSQNFYMGPSDSAKLCFSFGVTPGFYRFILESDGNIIEKAVIGYEPEKITVEQSALDEAYSEWKMALENLAKTPVMPEVVKVKKTGGKLRNIYKVTLNSVKDGVVEGYYAVPKAKGIYPVVITCTDRAEVLWMPDGNSNVESIDFVVSPRNGVIHNESHYYNICMDVVRAVDFIVQKNEVDLKNIFLQGRGQGAALAIGAAALDNRITAVAAYAPALSNEKLCGQEKLYDIKNLSGFVKCPVVMGVGLEDTVCPPHLNFEIYNPLKTVKEYYIFVAGHYPDAVWSELVDNFFMKHLQ